MEPVDLSGMRAEHVVPLTGETFSLTTAENAVLPLVLVRVRERKCEAPEGYRTPFALEFLAPPGIMLPQRIYRVTHPVLGMLEIFLTAVSAGPQGNQHEAVLG